MQIIIKAPESNDEPVSVTIHDTITNIEKTYKLPIEDVHIPTLIDIFKEDTMYGIQEEPDGQFSFII